MAARGSAVVRLSLIIAGFLAIAPRATEAGLLDGLIGGAAGSACTPLSCGSFSDAFAEPTIAGQPTGEKCITGADGQPLCKPAAGSVALLADGRILYWDALEGT